MKEKAQSLESQLKMARPRRHEVKRVPLTPEEKAFLGEIMDKAVAAEKAGELQAALNFYTDYKNELLRIKETREKEKKEETGWTKEKLVKWVENVFKTPPEEMTFEEKAHKIFDIPKLPKLETVGDLELAAKVIDEFPANITIYGRLDLDRAVVKEWIGTNLDVNGDVLMDHAQIESLPENMHVDGNLDMNNSTIQDLPDELYVGADIFLVNCNKKVINKAHQLKSEGNIRGRVITEM